jgi:hypothetical protein
LGRCHLPADHVDVVSGADDKALACRPQRLKIVPSAKFPPSGGRPIIQLGYPKPAPVEALAEPVLEAVPLVSMRLLVFFDSEESAYQGGRRHRNILDV